MSQSSIQPPLGIGTILQSRYRVIKILGQGGFGRTYLAEDIGRFNELCALKELIPAQPDNYFLEKSKQLFQREATILYQIQHPQIPQFRATFEEDKRLFLVQDYVAGKTYRTLLDERLAAGQTFSETEVFDLLRQLLPVLAHIHSRGIIHRDISPDNIIRREGDGKPVLIDFGVVNELATRFQSKNNIQNSHQPTTVGKLGYAPSEQIQTGRAYPCSDLYALAVTAVVLLTGREPQELFDDTNLVWYWQDLVTVSPGFAQVLNRMLSYKPNDRYQSVAEVAKALQAIENQINPDRSSTPYHTANQHPGAEISRLQTVAVGRNPNLIQPNNQSHRPDPVIPAPKQRGIWESPWVFAPLAIAIAILAGMGGWAIMSSLLNKDTAQQRPIPQNFPSPVVGEGNQPTPTLTPTPQPSFTPTPTPTPTFSEPVTYNHTLNLTPGESTSVESPIEPNTTINYTFKGEQGQQLTASLEKEGALLTVLGPNSTPIDNSAVRVTSYQGTLPVTGDYTIQLTPAQGVAQTKYKLNLSLATSVAVPTPTPTPTSTPTSSPSPSVAVPSADTETISSEPGRKPISGRTSGRQQIKRYLVNLKEGQELSVIVTKGAVTLDIRGPNGQLLEDASKLLSWQAQVRNSGQYQIDVVPIPDQPVDFELLLDIYK